MTAEATSHLSSYNSLKMTDKCAIALGLTFVKRSPHDGLDEVGG